MRLTASQLALWCGGEVAAGDPEATAESYAHDSRALEPGACFVAMQGHRDGHDFVESAFVAGATVALVARVPAHLAMGPGRAVVRVRDPLAALQDIARRVRAERHDLRVVGITGSTGKTSTKDLLVAAAGRLRHVHANAESFNNEFGLPLTVLGVQPATEVLVTEMGARFAGDIAALCRIVQPDVGVVTNIGLAHAEHLGGPDGATAVKAELLEALPATGLAVLDADEPRTPWLARRTAAEVVTVGFGEDADVRATDLAVDDRMRVSFTIGGSRVELPVPGVHQARNAALAATVAHRLGVSWDDVCLSLRAAQGSRWRMELDTSPDGVTVCNDAYNANPSSMEAALRSFAHLGVTGRRIAVLGDMRELGAHGPDAHAAVGRLAATLGLDLLVAVGAGGALIAEAAAGVPDVVAVDDARAALHEVAVRVRAGDAVLVKASRALGLEAVAAGLLSGAAVGEGAA